MVISERAGPDERKRVLGIWDLHVSPASLGGVLILIAELQMQCLIHGVDLADICFVGDIAPLLPTHGNLVNGGPVTLLDSEACQNSAVLSALQQMEGTGACYLCSTMAALQCFLRESPCQYIVWPSLDEQGNVSHEYASTLFAQKFYRENGFIPYLSCKTGAIRWATHFIETYVVPYKPVVVHLKNNPNEQNCSNADSDAWLTFFGACHQRHDTRFILVGNDEIDERIRSLPNTLVARDFWGTLSRDLALIQTAFIFMGMASGPCNMALFSDIPYLIYKNPDHDAEQMALELGEGDRFPFATPFQKVLRVFETGENLMSEFAHLYSHVNSQDWERRLASLR